MPLSRMWRPRAATGWPARRIEIWVDDSSIVGSIGVIFASFGFPELMARQGIERRVVTAGRSKSFADPFLPQKPEDVERLKALQEPIHQAFIDHVKARRGARLDRRGGPVQRRYLGRRGRR